MWSMILLMSRLLGGHSRCGQYVPVDWPVLELGSCSFHTVCYYNFWLLLGIFLLQIPALLWSRAGHVSQGYRHSQVEAHCCHMDTAIKHPVPARVKPSFVFSFVLTSGHSGLSVRVPGCQN